MNVFICVKQVPGTTQVEVDPVTGVLKRDGVASKLNPYDLYAIEAAMELKEKYGAYVKAFSMGPMQAKEALIETICMGADDGVLLSDRKFAGADVLATAYCLSQGLAKGGQYDLILCGKQTTDGDTAQVGAEIAEFLNIPHANNVLSIIEVTDEDVTVLINLENHIATQRIALPCLLCMDSDINTPRLPSYKRIKEINEEASIQVITLADMDDKDEMHYGLNGSPTKVERIFPPEKKTDREIIEGTHIEVAMHLGDLFAAKKFI